MSIKFPEMMNSGEAEVNESKKEITFTYLDSYIQAITETKPLLTSKQIISLVDDRIRTFSNSPAGSRESDELRTDRKYVAAHPTSLLKEAFNKMNDEQKAEFDMMLSHSSHHGISNPDEVEEYVDPKEEIPFAGEKSDSDLRKNKKESKGTSKSSIIDYLTPDEDY